MPPGYLCYHHASTSIQTQRIAQPRGNDTKGHEAGDALLVRAVDLVARLGGDEFGLLMVDCDEEAAGVCAMRLRDGLDQAGYCSKDTGICAARFNKMEKGLKPSWSEPFLVCFYCRYPVTIVTDFQ